MGIMEALLSFIRRQIGLRTDTASATGSAHAKLAQLLADTTELLLTKRNGIVIASDTLKASADTERTSTSDTYAKIKEIQVLVKGVVRVTFDMKASSGLVYGAVYVNGVLVVESSTEGLTYSTFTHDISVNELDSVQLYRKVAGGSVRTGYWKNFRIKYDYSADEYVVKTD